MPEPTPPTPGAHLVDLAALDGAAAREPAGVAPDATERIEPTAEPVVVDESSPRVTAEEDYDEDYDEGEVRPAHLRARIVPAAALSDEIVGIIAGKVGEGVAVVHVEADGEAAIVSLVTDPCEDAEYLESTLLFTGTQADGSVVTVGGVNAEGLSDPGASADAMLDAAYTAILGDVDDDGLSPERAELLTAASTVRLGLRRTDGGSLHGRAEVPVARAVDGLRSIIGPARVGVVHDVEDGAIEVEVILEGDARRRGAVLRPGLGIGSFHGTLTFEGLGEVKCTTLGVA